ANTNFPTAIAATPNGIGPALSIASDNTLGAYSPYEGRLYATYTDRQPNITQNPADNTDIWLTHSDDGGQSWSSAVRVNDDNANTDGFSEGSGTLFAPQSGRPQFQSSVSVDNTTGTVVLSWYDARYDASRARVAQEITTSIDGGTTFSPDIYANPS